MRKLLIHSNGKMSITPEKGVVIKHGKNDKPIVKSISDGIKLRNIKVKNGKVRINGKEVNI